MSEPTKEALKIAHEYMSDCPDDVDMARLALAIDAHTQVLRTENAQLRERLRMAVEARKAWKYAALLSPPPLHGASEKLAREADAACHAAGVEVWADGD